MRVGIPNEIAPGERRIALIPAQLPQLKKLGIEVIVEKGAGESAGFNDSEYQKHGAQFGDRDAVFKADLLLQVRAFGAAPNWHHDRARLRSGQAIIAFCEPLSEHQATKAAAELGVTLLSMELMPRITRAQSMDALSSMATIAGYQAVLIAATRLPRMFPMMMTAAGTLAPAKALVIGVGVAGLQAISTAKRLGAVVEAYDVRPAVKEQVQSVGAKFVELDLDTTDSQDKGGYAKALTPEQIKKQQQQMAVVVARNDVVITTAAVPGKKAPVLVTAAMARGMARGSVIVDLAAERGGNCELTQAGKEIEDSGVTIIGPLNLPSTKPYHASQMYSKNITTFLAHLVKDGALKLDMNDEIARETLVTQGGEVKHARVRELMGLAPPATPAAPAARQGG